MLATIKHRSHGQPMYWEADVVRGSDGVYRGRIIARVILGSAEPVNFEVSVCTQARLRHGAFIISRADDNAWILTPALALDDNGRKMAEASNFADRIPIGTIALTAAPDDVAADLARL